MNGAFQETQDSELGRTPFCKIVAEMQKCNVDLLTSANEIVLKAAKSMRENQLELLRLETGQISDLMVAVPLAADLGEGISSQNERWRENSQKMIDTMRGMNDLAYDCGWQLIKLCARRIQQTA